MRNPEKNTLSAIEQLSMFPSARVNVPARVAADDPSVVEHRAHRLPPPLPRSATPGPVGPFTLPKQDNPELLDVNQAQSLATRAP